MRGSTTTGHWYFLSAVETWAKPSAAAAVMLGDSLTGGRGSTTNKNDRWPDRLLDRLQSHPATSDIAIVNQAAGGNRVLNDGLGPNVLARLDRDVLAQSGVKWLVVFGGVNDIGTAEATPAAQKETADRLIAAYEQIIVRAHAQGIRVYGGTLTPFGGNDMYDDENGHREGARQTVNRWIRTSRRFDGVIDLDRAARDPADPRRLHPAYDTGDGLHLNPAGSRPWRTPSRRASSSTSRCRRPSASTDMGPPPSLRGQPDQTSTELRHGKPSTAPRTGLNESQVTSARVPLQPRPSRVETQRTSPSRPQRRI